MRKFASPSVRVMITLAPADSFTENSTSTWSGQVSSLAQLRHDPRYRRTELAEHLLEALAGGRDHVLRAPTAGDRPGAHVIHLDQNRAALFERHLDQLAHAPDYEPAEGAPQPWWRYCGALLRYARGVSEQPTVAFFPEPGAWGPTNNLVAVGNHLRERGIRVVFVVEESFEGELEKRGFEEALMRMAPPPEHEEQVGEGWAEFIRVTAPEFRKPTIEQLETVTMPIWAELADGAKYAHDRMLEIWEEVRPDAIVTDNVTGFPAVSTAGVPWARMVSANPLEMHDAEIPPVFSGYPADDHTGWDEFRAEYRRLHDPLIADLSEFNQSKGAAPLPEGSFQYESPWLNMYLFPGVIDYPRATPLGDTWHRLDTSVRASDPEFDVSERVPGDGKVVYLSLGSLGCMDIGLMQRIIDLLDRTEHRAIVSMGPLHEELRLGERMYGEQFPPQTSILPQCDLLITHGGNNTIDRGRSTSACP